MTFRTSRTMRCGVGGNRPSSARSRIWPRISLRSPVKGRINSQLAFDPVSQQREAGTDIADHFRVGEIHLLDAGGGKADMDHFRTVRAHDEWWFLHRVVPDRNDEIGMVDGAVHVIA